MSTPSTADEASTIIERPNDPISTIRRLRPAQTHGRAKPPLAVTHPTFDPLDGSEQFRERRTGGHGSRD